VRSKVSLAIAEDEQVLIAKQANAPKLFERQAEQFCLENQ
jgi:hypothetical protein